MSNHAATAPMREKEAWQQAAQDFRMNTDFDISSQLAALSDSKADDADADAEESAELSLGEVMQVMKDESKGKQTIQALGDKILLHQMLENLGVPQMPVLFATHGQVNLKEVEELVEGLHSSYASGKKDAFDIVVKPTHLSNGTGALILDKASWDALGMNAEKLYDHMQTHLDMQADDCESEALKALVPGFTVQPRYRSLVDFVQPLELRVVTLWGKARVGIWWWGRPAAPNTTESSFSFPQRTAWISRRQRFQGTLSKHDDWDVLHNHAGWNPGFNAALKIFHESMPAMAAAAEAIAKATGAPFLRSDFFVGSKQWGVRLNEVAYGSGCDMKRRFHQEILVDDSPEIARILAEGMQVAKSEPPQCFLERLGVEGSAYEVRQWRFWKRQEKPGLDIKPLTDQQRPRLPTEAECGFKKASESNVPTLSTHLCKTIVIQPPAQQPQHASPLKSGSKEVVPAKVVPAQLPQHASVLNSAGKEVPAKVVVRQVSCYQVPARLATPASARYSPVLLARCIPV